MDVVLLSGGLVESIMMQRYIGPYKNAHWLRKNGYNVQVIDFIDAADEQILTQLLKKFVTNSTLVIGISTTFFSTNTSPWSDGTERFIPEFLYNSIRTIKQEFGNIKIIVGGYMSEKIPSYGLFDATIMSYTAASEDIFLEYVNHLRTGSAPPNNKLEFPIFSGSKPRLHYYDANVKTYNIETDDFKFIAQDNIMPGEPLPLDVSRGCIFACRFCQYPHLGKKKLDYVRGMEYLEQEVRSNYENFGTTDYYILDDTFNDTEIKIDQFLKMSQRLPFKLGYAAYIRADLVHRFPDTAHMLLESGLNGAYHGLESLHPDASKIVGKGWSGVHARDYMPKLYHDVWNKKVAQQLSFIVGLTGENSESIDDTVKWFLDSGIASARFIPLGLFGNNKGSVKTIQSEFDKNSEKYGFTIKQIKDNGRVNWENDFWTNHTASDKSKKIMSDLKNHTRYAAWSIPGLKWYGYEQQQIQTMKRVEFDTDGIRSKTIEMKRQYFDKLLNG